MCELLASELCCECEEGLEGAALDYICKAWVEVKVSEFASSSIRISYSQPACRLAEWKGSISFGDLAEKHQHVDAGRATVSHWLQFPVIQKQIYFVAKQIMATWGAKDLRNGIESKY